MSDVMEKKKGIWNLCSDAFFMLIKCFSNRFSFLV